MLHRSLFGVLAAILLSSAASAQTLEDRVRALELKSQSSGGASAGAANAAYNPPMGAAIDMILRTEDADRGYFDFRSAEINLGAPIDPHAKAWLIVNGRPDEVDVEEATIQTTSLPANLTVRGGRIFAPFGRLPHFHDHELPFVDRTPSLDRFIGGESRGDGLEASWIAPMDRFVAATLGAYNRLGAENERATDAPRRFDEFTYLANLHTALEFEDHILDLGASSAWTPKRSVEADSTVALPAPNSNVTLMNTWRLLNGVDLTYRWQPASGGVYKGMLAGVEVFQNTERIFDDASKLPVDRRRAYGGYGFVQVKVGRSWRPGAFADLAQDLNNPKNANTKTFGGFITFNTTEFHRLRLQYSRQSEREKGRRVDSRIALQWTAIIGYHVHGFRDR